MKKLMVFSIAFLLVGTIFAQQINSGETYVVQNEDGRPVYKVQKLNPFADNDAKRVVAKATDQTSKNRWKQKGCKIVHELRDGTSMICSKREARRMLQNREAEPDNLNQVFDLESDVFINADEAWSTNYDGTGVTVAVLDTGVNRRHPELRDSIRRARSFVGYPRYDTTGHGTHVIGIITANGGREIDSGDYWLDVANPNEAQGVAEDTRILSGKVCSETGCYDSDVEAGIEWAVNRGADIIHMSLGSGSYAGHCDETRLAKKVNWAVDQGVVVVAAAGNYNSQVCTPACASKAIAVGAVYQKNVGTVTYGTMCADVITREGQRACFSNYGEALDIMAPGVGILSTYPNKGYAWMTGTSQAAPHVTAVAAMMLEKNPDLEPSQVKKILEDSATKSYAGYNRNYYGAGIVNAEAAVDATPVKQVQNKADDDSEEKEYEKYTCEYRRWRCNCDGKCQRYEYRSCADCS